MNTASVGTWSCAAMQRAAATLVVVSAVGLSTAAATAQTGTRPHFTVNAGITEYDLAGTGTTAIGALGASFPITPFLSIDPAFGVLRYEEQFGSDIVFLLPETSVRLQIPGRTVNPYLAVGGGFAPVIQGRGETDATLHVAIGTYIWVSRRWALRPEARMRSIEPFVGSTADLTFGLSRRW